MPDKPNIDHRFLGLVHRAILDVSPRVAENCTQQIEHPRFREVSGGRIYELVLSQQAATNRPAQADKKPKSKPKADKPTAVDLVLDAVRDGFAHGDPGMVKDVEFDGTTVTFASAADGTSYAVAAEEVTEHGEHGQGHGPETPTPAPVRVTHATPPPPPPPAAPMASQSTPGTSPV